MREGPEKEVLGKLLLPAAVITHALCYLNSAVNPIIYYFMSAQFKGQVGINPLVPEAR